MKKQNKTDLIPAVAYARYSSSGQREESIEGQLREIKAFAKHNGFRIIKEYADRAQTGTNDQRPAFQQMIADSAKKKFQAVICWKTDRFSRSRYDSATYKHRLRKNGVQLYYVRESIPDGPSGIVVEAMLEGFAEFYSASLSENVKRGNMESVMKHRTLGRKVLGYRKSAEDTFEIDPDEAPIVKMIFDRYDAGDRMVDIIDDLNSRGLRTRFGGPYNKSSLGHILKNEKYIGVYEFSGYREEDVIPPIIDKEQFARVQARLKSHAKAPRQRDGARFILTSKLFCGHCGEPMTGDSATGEHGQLYLYYTCRKRRIHECDKKRVKKEDIEAFVIKKLLDLIFDDQFIEDLADECMEYQKNLPELNELKILQTQLADVQRQIGNLTTALAQTGAIPAIVQKISELSDQEAQLQTSITETQLNMPILERDQIVFMLHELRSGNVDDPMYQARLVETFLNSIYLYDDGRCILNLNYSGNNSTVTFEDMNTFIDSSDKGVSSQPSDAKTNFYIFLEGIATMEARFRAF